jgi:hypothetical protein
MEGQVSLVHRLFSSVVVSDSLFHAAAISGLNDSQLLHQREIVLNVPVVGNPAVLHAQNVSRDEIYSLTRSLLLSKSAIEMAPKMEMCDHAVAGNNQLFYVTPQVRHRLAEIARREKRSINSLRTAFR